MKTIVELEGVNGEWFTLAGPQAGDQGVYLATDVKGLHEPPVKVTYEEPGNYPGSRYLNHRVLRRDITFAVHILDDRGDSWMSRDSEWRKAWAFDRDCKLHITTEEFGTRYLKVRLGESPEVSLFSDPNENTINQAVMVVIAGDPFWYEDDVVYSALTLNDTSFHPSLLPNPFEWDSLPKETLTISVDPSDGHGGLNPTDQYIFPKWTVPGSLSKVPDFPWPFPPGIPIPWERAPFTQFVIPDYSFEDDALADRRLRTPGLIYGEDCVIDSDPRVEQFSSASGSQVWARTNGVRFRHPIPPWTPAKDFVIDVAGCPAGQMITLRLPRPWSRPWGLA